MNSCRSILLSACCPPLSIFIIGTGMTNSALSDKYSYSGTFSDLAAALQTAIDTPKMALAPSLLLFSVPSSSIILLSIADWSLASIPDNSDAISLFTFSTAVRTPLPRYLALSPSRSSIASCSPVDAPEGTIAVPVTPSSSFTSTETVGFPLESKSSNAFISSIFATNLFP